MKNNLGVSAQSSVVWFVLALFFALTAWAFASPLGSSPDEDYHLTSIWCAQGNRESLCEINPDNALEVTVPATLVSNSACFAFNPDISANCKTETPNGKLTTTRSNAGGGYPPVFYWVMSLFSTSDLATSVLSMRIFNTLLFAGMMFVTFLFSQKSLRSPLFWGSAISIVPLGMFIIPSINPSSWAVISASILWVSLIGFFHAHSSRDRIALGIISVTALIIGAGARSDAAVYAGIAVIVAIILSWKEVKSLPKLLFFPGVLTVICLFFFFIGGQSSVISTSGGSSSQSLGSTIALAVANLTRLPELWIGALGTWGLGWLDTELPGIVWVTTFALFVAFVFSGLKNSSRAKGVSLSLLSLSLIAIPLYILVKGNIMVGSDVQPRYIYPLMIIFAGVALYQLVPGKDTFSGLQLYIAATGLTVANSIALHVNLRRYVTGIDVQGFNLESLVEWWWQIPVGPLWIWALGTLAFGIAMFSLARYSKLEWSNTESSISKV